jgi:diguanylate cyclase (GGDEF)-like protein
LAAEADAFDEQEVELLAAATSDLGFGIAALHTRVRALQAEETIRRMAYCDALTGLPNRSRLRELLAEAIRATKSERRSLALLHPEVGRMQEIEESVGYREGDRLQQEVANLLVQTAGTANTVARTGECEFSVLMPNGGAEHASHLAQKILTALDEPIELSGLFLEAKASIGIALHPGHGTDPDALLHRARIALGPTRRSGIGYALFKGGQDLECSQRLALMRDLRQAIEHDELLLHYQPKLQISTHTVCGSEALVRWQHPQHGLLRPDSFIKLAESTGLITPLTYWVLDAALSQRYAWHQAGIDRPVAVNLSARDFRDPKLLDRISGSFSTWGGAGRLDRVRVNRKRPDGGPSGDDGNARALEKLGRTDHH